MKPLAKSLHTVTVLVRVASLLLENDLALDKGQAIDLAILALRLDEMPDTYGLGAAALKQLRKH